MLEKLLMKQKTPSINPILTISKNYLMNIGLWDNTVQLSGMRRTKSYVYYEGATIIGKKFKGKDLTKSLDLSTVEQQTVILLGLVKEWTYSQSNVAHCFPISLSGNIDNDEYVVLMISSNKQKHVSQDSLWTNDFVNGVTQMFRDTMLGKTDKHHSSVGTYYGFGMTAKYESNNGFSFGKISTKQNIDISLHKEYCQIIENDINFSATELNNTIPNIVQSGQIVTQCLANLCKTLTNTHTNLPSFAKGMVSAYICHNAQSYDRHIETDCTYTMIISPMCGPGLNDTEIYVFEFEWNGESDMIQLLMNQGTIVYYNGHGIGHRQINKVSGSVGNFWNISSYANQKLFNHIICSMKNVNSIYRLMSMYINYCQLKNRQMINFNTI